MQSIEFLQALLIIQVVEHLRLKYEPKRLQKLVLHLSLRILAEIMNQSHYPI